MATFQEHLNQANKNIKILSQTNLSITNSCDWQLTMCFYVAVHLANAHIANKINAHYRTHDQVGNALNFAVPVSATKIDQDSYLSYIKLYGLSRRARYLCSDDKDNKSIDNHLTIDKHVAKAIKNLDRFMTFFKTEYGYVFFENTNKMYRIKKNATCLL